MSTQRSRKYRENLKLPENREKYEAYLDRRRKSNQNYVQKMLRDKKSAKKFRVKEQKRVKKFRKSQQPKIVNGPIESIFPSVSARSKAVVKTQKSLPIESNRRQEILNILTKRNNVTCIVPQVASKKPRKGFPEIEEIVTGFFCSDLITRQMPGVKDFVILKNDLGEKQKVQKRVLTISLARAYEEFLNMFPHVKIGLSKFCAIRPKNVLLFSEEVQYSFKCVHCENAKFLFSSIASFIADFTNSLDSVMDKFCCDDENYLCVSSLCPVCYDHKDTLMGILQPNCLDEIVHYQEWQKIGGFTEKVSVSTGTVQEVIDKILSRLEHLKMHIYLKKIQQRYFYNTKHAQSAKSATIVVDFAENYAAKGQNEVQSSYFGRRQLSVFTCVAYIGQEQEESFAIINDSIQHSKEQVHFYLKLIIGKLKEKYDIEHLSVFSDGCSSQFKNRFILSSVMFAKQDYNFSMDWNFFCTSHGKSSADGVGAVVKRGVYQRVLLNQFSVYSAREFVECCETFCKKTIVIEVKQDEVNEEAKIIQKRWSNIKKIEGSREFHCFKSSLTNGFILAAKSSLMDGQVDISVLK